MASSSALSKATAERHQRILLELLKQPGNEVCADCRTRNPRWASWNLGIFICVKCAGIHRKLGTHITKVKSLTMDSWTKEQVQSMKQLGNAKSNRLFNPNDSKNPPPTDLEESERDSQLEKFIRMKYEYKRFMDLHSKAGSTSNDSASVAKSLSLNASGPSTHSPSSSVHWQSSDGHSSVSLRPSSVASNTRAVVTHSWTQPNSLTHADRRLKSSLAVPNGASQAATQPNGAFKGSPVISMTSSIAVPPLRPSTAPIPSDAHNMSSQNAPPVPNLPLFYTSLGQGSFQTNNTGKPHNLTPCQPDQPFLAMHLRPNQSRNQAQNHPTPPRRTDGIWGDLMQLTEPNVKPNPVTHTTSFGSMPQSYHSTTVSTGVYPPLNSTYPTNMSSLEARMGKLMQEPATAMTLGINGTGMNQQLAPTNPFLSQIQQPHLSAFRTNNTTSQFQPTNNFSNSVNGTNSSSSSPFQSTHSINPLMHNQNGLLINQHSRAPPTSFEPLQSSNLNLQPSPNRNPFMSSNLNTISGDYYAPNHQTPHQQPSLSINQHTTLF